MARVRVKNEVYKPFFGKPYLRYGQCYAIWTYFFQLGGILGGRHSGNIDAFARAFLGVKGPPDAVKKLFVDGAPVVADVVKDSMNFQDYVASQIMARVEYAGDALTYFAEHGCDKIPPSTAVELAHEFSIEGAVLGAIYPQTVRQMFLQAYAPIPKDKWQQARAAGLNLPPEQDTMSYDETEKGENELFMLYCQKFCPHLHAVLNK